MTENYMAIHTCVKCGHKWPNRKAREPKMCPKCKTVNWNKKASQKAKD